MFNSKELSGLFAPTITNGVWRLCGVAVCALVVLMAGLLWGLQRIHSNGASFANTQAIESNLRSLGEDLLDAETGQRGYLLTQDEEYLHPYRSGIENAQSRIDSLRSLLLDPAGRSAFDRMVPLVSAKLEELSITVELARSGSRDAALRIVIAGSGQHLMDEFRILRAAVLRVETKILEKHRARVNDSMISAALILVLGGGATIVLLLVATLRTTQKIRQPMRSLVEGMRTVAAGSLEHRLAIVPRDEISEIAATFNDMSDRLAAARDAERIALQENMRSQVELGVAREHADSDQRLRNITNNLTEGLVISSIQGELLHWNKSACAMFGFTDEQEWLRKLPEFADTFELATLDGAVLTIEEWPLSRVLAGERLRNFEVYIRRLDTDSSKKILSFSGDSVQDLNGQSAAFLSFRDITQRKLAEHAVRASEQRYRFMSETMPQILWTAGPDGNPDFFNQRWFAYTGLTIEESKDWSGWGKAVHPDDLPNVNERWTQAYSTGGEYVAEYRFKRAADGAYRWQLGRASPFRNADGVIIHWVGTCTDIDDQKRAEHNLLQAHATLEERVRERTAELAVAKDCADSANRSKSEFLANMSHEIRTPLNAVIGLGYLLEQTTLNDDQRQLLTKIQFAGRALLGVINNVLDLSKIEAGEMSLENEPFDLVELVHDLSQMLAPAAKAKGIELIVRLAPEVPRRVTSDASRLRQILTNLVNNSIKFTEVGNVQLKVSCTDVSAERIGLRCEVTDTGIGIESDVLDRLFSPFTQADASTTRRFGGTGLGLSISRRFVEMMGGRIGVTSTIAVGSTFWFEVPLNLALMPDGAVSIPDVPHSLRICIADSKGDGPESLSALVRALGWIPQVAETDEQLLQIVSRLAPNLWPDVFILDLQLHATAAGQLITRLQGECKQRELPPTVIVAPSEQAYLESLPFMRSTDAMLARPVSSSALFNAINSVVWRRTDEHERVLHATHFDERQAQWLAQVHVLVVDDSDINLEVARRILEKQGALVATCSDGAAAFEHVRTHHRNLDIVLMDVQMPLLDGNEATRRIRDELGLATLPIVALTAGALEGERQRSIEAGMNDFVSKPFDPMVLIRKVRRLVELARGEPIPMVILDKTPVAHSTDVPLISSIDASVVQQMFGEDVPLFKTALAGFLRDYAELSVPLCIPPDDQAARSTLKARAHRLKGSAGMIGATRLMRLAGAAERALEEGRPVEGAESLLIQLASALTTLREEAKPFLERQPEFYANTGGPIATRSATATAEVNELCALLEAQNLAAIDKFSALSAVLRTTLDAVHFDRLCIAMDNLNFQLAATLLRDSLHANLRVMSA